MKPGTLFKITNVFDRITSSFIQSIIIITNILIFIAGFFILLLFHNINSVELMQQTTQPAAMFFFNMLQALGWVMIVNILCRFIFMLHSQTQQTVVEEACTTFATLRDRAYEERHDDGSIAFTSMIHQAETEKHNTVIKYDSDGRVSMVEQFKFPNSDRKEAPHNYRDQVFFQEGHVIAIHTVDDQGIFISERMINRLDADNTEDTSLTEHLSNARSPLPQS